MFAPRHLGLCLASLIATAGLLFGPADVAHANSNDYSYSSYLTPNDPRVGEVYSLVITVRNNSGRPMHFNASIASLPGGDRVLDGNRQSRYVGAGGSCTFRFDIYCGVLGGTVRYNVGASWAD